jgi:hypothetical protein
MKFAVNCNIYLSCMAKCIELQEICFKTAKMSPLHGQMLENVSQAENAPLPRSTPKTLF